MSKITLSSLSKIANKLDDLQLYSFANEVDDIMNKISQTTDAKENMQQELQNTEMAFNKLNTQTIPKQEQTIKDTQKDLANNKTNITRSLQQRITELREQLRKQKEGQTFEEQSVAPQTPATAQIPTLLTPANYTTVI